MHFLRAAFTTEHVAITGSYMYRSRPAWEVYVFSLFFLGPLYEVVICQLSAVSSTLHLGCRLRVSAHLLFLSLFIFGNNAKP